MTNEPNFLSIRATARKYAGAGFTEASLRWLAFNRQHNGFDRAFCKVGRRLLIDESEFVAAIRGHGQPAKAVGA